MVDILQMIFLDAFCPGFAFKAKICGPFCVLFCFLFLSFTSKIVKFRLKLH